MRRVAAFFCALALGLALAAGAQAQNVRTRLDGSGNLQWYNGSGWSSTAPLTLPLPTTSGGIGNATGDLSLLSVEAAYAQVALAERELHGNTLFTAAFGSYCDGSRHYLNTITSYGGQNTTGWTLAQWQAVFPSLPNTANVNTTDIDGLAISAAFAYARNLASHAPVYIKFSGKGQSANNQCYAPTSIDWTNLSRLNLIIDGSGFQLNSSATSLPAIDATGSQNLVVENLSIIGNCTFEPQDGLRMARVQPGQGVGSFSLINLKIEGCYKAAALRVVSAEDNHYLNLITSNADTSGGVAEMWDGINHGHYQATSQFASANSEPVDTYESFTTNIIDGGSASCQHCLAPVWMSSMHGAWFRGHYVVNSSPAGTNYAVQLYENAASPTTRLVFDGHIEGPNGIVSSFLLSSNGATPTLYDFNYDDEADQSASSLFTTDTAGAQGTAIIGVTLVGGNLTVNVFGQNASAGVFDQPSIYSGNADVNMPSSANWSLPGGQWTGRVCLGGVCNNQASAYPMNVNSDFYTDNCWTHGGSTSTAGTGACIADGWTQFLIGGTGGKLTFQAVANGAPGAYYSERFTVANTYSVAAGDIIAMRGSLTGDQLAALLWGTASAQPITVDMWAKSSIAGFLLPFYAANGVNTRCWTHDLSLTTAWQEFVFTIPAYTSVTGFSFTPNAPSLRYGVALDAGSTYQVANSAGWNTVSGLGACGSTTMSHLLATASATVSVGPIRLYPGANLPTYQVKPFGLATSETMARYEKSEPVDIGPGTDGTYKTAGSGGTGPGAGLQGAFQVVVPYAGTGSNTFKGFVPFANLMFGTSATAPVIAIFSTGASTQGAAYDTTGSHTCGTVATSASNLGFQFTVTLDASVAANDNCAFQWTATAQQ